MEIIILAASMCVLHQFIKINSRLEDIYREAKSVNQESRE